MYTFESRVRYSEIDESGALALSSVINYMQDCSTFQSEEMGLGVEYLREHGQVWLLNSWQYLVKANSIWVFYDWNKSRPARITENIEQSYGREPKLEMNYAERKIAVPEGGVAEEPFPIRRHQIDTNGHVNNGQYIQMAQEYVPHVSEIRSLRAEYRKSAVYGNSIYPVVASVEDGLVISLNDEEGKPYAVIAFSRK